MAKKQGIWYLTSEGENALDLGAEKAYELARKAYRDWRKEAKSDDQVTDGDFDTTASAGPQPQAAIHEVQQSAIDGLRRQVESRNAYEFQDLVAALLRGMGYYTPFIAPKGKDGGVGIVAYRDPLGTLSPRIPVQAKHKEQAASVQEVRQLLGILQKDGDIGIFVSSGGFTPDAKSVRGVRTCTLSQLIWIDSSLFGRSFI